MAFLQPPPLPFLHSAQHTSHVGARRPLRRRPRAASPCATLAEPMFTKLPVTTAAAVTTVAPTNPVEVIDCEQALLDVLERSAHQLVVIRVHARWCRSCRALEPKWRRLARETPAVYFAELEFEANRILAARLGVKVMPTFQIFDADRGKVDHFSCGPRRAALLRERVELALDNRQRRLDGRPLLDVPDVNGSGAPPN